MLKPLLLTALESLYCTDNQLSSLDVSNKTALTELFCFNNQLSSLNLKKVNNSIPFVDLNLRNNPNLSCIQVNDAVSFNANWSNRKDATSYYSENCP